MSKSKDFTKLRTGDLSKRYALRFDESGSSYGWTPVMGRRFYVPDWFNFPLFTYRDDYVVFSVHEPTGLTLSVGPTQTDAIAATVALLAGKIRPDFFKLITESHKKLPIGPNPHPTYDTRSASETPRAKAPSRRGRPSKTLPVQGV